MANQHVPQIELVVPILPDMELTASKTAQAVAEFMKLDDEKTAEVTMALIEACINAFEHGKSKENNIYIRFIMRPGAMEIQIRDKGVGFDTEKIEVPEIGKKLHSKRKRGWGLQLMRELMDEVKIDSNENGTTITMVKKI